ncbi:putative quinol monooxygenase [Leptothoe spongobia]|uniref:Antibiotic biosynthesis monooxygenase n=1 Tax=Leptothoe spongobia TAU-MAC 1115 TaxID=1967444 RepID=A0A947DFC7_9CYAN|nr:antibiotic biosynthesis monooxygenase [Leptothoe spongobia]MBT9316007.1 antibiotic biosynthesis monooxygenase [Leptothoe spongobia TAU-MAC 1115]
MTDFSDFLKHKQAYIAIGEFKPGRFSQARQLYEQAVGTFDDGFQGAYLFQEPGTDRGIAVILWDNVDNMEANQSPTYQAIVRELSALFATPPDIKFYEVCSEIGLMGQLAQAVAA